MEGRSHYLKPIGGKVPAWYSDITICKYVNTTPDWFDPASFVCKNLIAIHIEVTNAAAKGRQRMDG